MFKLKVLAQACNWTREAEFEPGVEGYRAMSDRFFKELGRIDPGNVTGVREVSAFLIEYTSDYSHIVREFARVRVEGGALLLR